MSTHRHRARQSEHRVYGWSRCVAETSCSGAAHGGVTYVDRCACGATRLTESNGRHEMRGPWHEALSPRPSRYAEIV